MFDLIIKNASIADGTGNPLYQSDIAIQYGKIAKIDTDLSGAAQTIDASGCVVAPGFIDSHGHAEDAVFTYPELVEKLEQGITTSVSGCCGDSFISKTGNNKYNTVGQYLQAAKDIPLGANMLSFVGHSSVRLLVIGMENRPSTPEELEKMKALVAEAMENGALGLSFGLIYTPSCYAETTELVELAKVVKKYGGILSAHIRDEGDRLIEAVEEFIEVVKQSGARGVISHHKAAWKRNWDKTTKTLTMIDQAIQDGCELYCDVYPYTASQTSINARFIPKEYHAYGIKKALSEPEKRAAIKKANQEIFGDDLSFALVTACDAYPHYIGKNLNEIAKIHGKDPHDTVLDMIMDSQAACRACYFSMCDEDVERVMQHPRAMICTDSGVAGNSTNYHPRMRGTFPRALGRYVREKNVVSLPEMIRKMTALPAHVYNLPTKGYIREGYDADICIFDPDTIIDRAEYANCTLRNEGLHYVLVGGKIAVLDNSYNGIKNGKMILK